MVQVPPGFTPRITPEEEEAVATAVFDEDQILRDPDKQNYPLPQYQRPRDANGNIVDIHPTDAGYQALGNGLDLCIFSQATPVAADLPSTDAPGAGTSRARGGGLRPETAGPDSAAPGARPDSAAASAGAVRPVPVRCRRSNGPRCRGGMQHRSHGRLVLARACSKPRRRDLRVMWQFPLKAAHSHMAS